ncbi:hypothetical protein ACFYZ8_38625 [Streptomyces sp. NPDC001668]|uniref:hypothetical protein n=1 Tax=unclassified Streptomyces TaxID=2593676 RepID=UPI0036B1AF59
MYTPTFAGVSPPTAAKRTAPKERYVDSAGHCTFSPGEQIAALHTLEDGIAGGHWRDSDPAALNSRATEAGPGSPAHCLPYSPSGCPRPYDRAHPRDGHRTPALSGHGSDVSDSSEARVALP